MAGYCSSDTSVHRQEPGRHPPSALERTLETMMMMRSRSLFLLLLLLALNAESFYLPQSSRHRILMLSARSFNKNLHQFVKNNSKIPNIGEQAEERLMNSKDRDVVSFNIVLNAWAKQHSWQAARRADRLLSRMMQEELTPDSYSYAAVLHAYAKSGGKIPAAQRAQEILDQTMEFETDICHNAVMDAWAVSGHPKAGEKAERILRQLGSKATLVSYNACLKAYAKNAEAHEGQRILEEMRQKFKPDKVSLSTCIDAWAKSGAPEAAEKAEELLHEMESAKNIQPDVVAYTSVLAAGAKDVGSLLARMERYAQKPNAAFLNTWIHMMKTTKNGPDTSKEAEKILNYMKREYKNGKNFLRPCRVTYTSVISIMALAGRATRAEELLDELEHLWRRTGDDDYRPSARTFASVLNAWAKTDPRQPAIERADVLLNRMEQLYRETNAEDLRINSVIFAQLFQILSNSRHPAAASRAVELLRRMNELHEQGYQDVRPDSTTMAYFLNTLTKAGVENKVELASHILNEVEVGYAAGMGHLKPTSLLYSAVLQAYAKSNSSEGAELAEKLLEKTKSMYKEGKIFAKPNVMFYNAVIDAHARSNCGTKAAERAEDLLDEMEARSESGDVSLKPNTRSFNAVVLAWRNSNSTDAPYRAEKLLHRMIKRWESGENDCKPDRVTFNSIIGVWAKSDTPVAGEKAEEMLHEMMSLYQNGHEDLKPDLYSYNTCIHAYARTGNAMRAQAIYDLILKGNERNTRAPIKPDVITFTSLRQAWLNSPGPKADIALELISGHLKKCEHRKEPKLGSPTNAKTTLWGTVRHNVTIATS